MSISAKLVKELRELTSAGMMDCKKALTEADGNIDKAVEILRKKGIGKASKKSDRSASEGIVCTFSNEIGSTILELNSETDFVAKNQNFKDLAKDISKHILDINVENIEDIKTSTINGQDFNEFFNSKIALIGENLILRRFKSIKKPTIGAIVDYVHMDKIAVLISVKYENSNEIEMLDREILNIAMHIAAMNPSYLSESQIPKDIISKEEEIAIELLKKEGKPEKIWDKILPGKIAKFKKENTLFGQQYIIDDKKTIKSFIDELSKQTNNKIEITEFTRYELGEGLEKKVCDFASEVASQLK